MRSLCPMLLRVAMARREPRSRSAAAARDDARRGLCTNPMSPRLTRRIHRTRAPGSDPGDEPDVVELESVELSGVFSAPQWLRDLGFASWLLAGVGAVLIGATWIAALTSTIVVPVVVAGVVAAVTSPLVRMLQRRGLPRAAGAALVFLGLLVLGAAFVVMVVGGISSQASDLTPKLAQGADKIQGWLQDLGVSSESAQQANSDAGAGLSDAFHALLTGVATGVEALASLAVFLSFTALSLFFFLKDGPVIRAWAERHLGVPRPVGHIVVGRTLQSLRGYFVGVTAVAAFNGIVIGLGALIVGVPQAGSIAVVNFAAAYIPFLGAWSAGAFTVLIALGAQGTDAAIAMTVIVLLANGALQQLVQPIAMGAALGIHPLAVLVVTIASGALFGIVGMVLAAPLVSAAVRISADLAASRARAAEEAAAVSARAEPGPAGSAAGSKLTAMCWRRSRCSAAAAVRMRSLVGRREAAEERPRPQALVEHDVDLGGDEAQLRGQPQPREQADDGGEDPVGLARPCDDVLDVEAAERLQAEPADRGEDGSGQHLAGAHGGRRQHAKRRDEDEKSIAAEPAKLAIPATGGWMVPLRARVTTTVVKICAVPMTTRMARPRSRACT